MSDTPEPAVDPVAEAPSEFVELAPQPEVDEQAGDDEAQHADDAPDDDDEEKDLRNEKPKFKRTLDGRLEREVYHRREAERLLDAANARLQEAHGGEVPAAKPTPDSYEDYGDFVEALADWKADQRDRQRLTADVARYQEQATKAAGEAWNVKIAEVATVLPDYEDVVGKSTIEIAHHVGEALMDADRGPELAYHLAKNPDAVARLNEMSPLRAAVELGKIEATLGVTTPTRRQSQAPTPITPVRSGSTTTKDPAKMTQVEYNKWRKEQLAG